MLSHLRVRNLGVLEDASIDPGPGFTVITGETGTGKTMLFGGLRLLTGEKAKQTAVGPFAEEAVSDGLFEDGDAELGVTRVVPRDGKSRAYLDGNLVAAGILEERLGGLVEIVGQHDQMLLRRSQSVLHLVDGDLDEEGVGIQICYEETWGRYRSAVDDQHRLGGDRTGLERELDLVRYQAKEIASAGLETGDDERAESMAARLRNSQMIREHLGLATQELEAASENTGNVLSRLRRIGAIDTGISEQLSMAETLSGLTDDLLRDIRDLAETASEDLRPSSSWNSG